MSDSPPPDPAGPAPDPQALAAIRTTFVHQQELSPEDIHVLFAWIAQLEADLTALRAERDQLKFDYDCSRSELSAITDLVGNRSEAGTYAQVEAELAEARARLAPTELSIRQLAEQLVDDYDAQRANDISDEQRVRYVVASLTVWARARLALPAWQPIETAPKDGTPLLIWADGSHIIHLFWALDHWEWLGGGRYPEHQYRMTHWMPLPPPPAAEGENLQKP